jgi:hypothetical protein
MFVLVMSQSKISSNDEKLGHRSEKLKFPVNALGFTVSVQISWKLVRKVAAMISSSSFNMGHLGSKTRSQFKYGKTLERLLLQFKYPGNWPERLFR